MYQEKKFPNRKETAQNKLDKEFLFSTSPEVSKNIKTTDFSLQRNKNFLIRKLAEFGPILFITNFERMLNVSSLATYLLSFCVRCFEWAGGRYRTRNRAPWLEGGLPQGGISPETPSISFLILFFEVPLPLWHPEGTPTLCSWVSLGPPPLRGF